MDVTSLSREGFSAAVSAITSAFGDGTRRDIYLYVREHPDGVTASQVAERFGLHQNVARHHLDKLTAGGHLEVTMQKAGRAGRPSKRYRVRQGTTVELPVRYDSLVLTLLARSLERLDPEEAEQIAEEVGFEYGRSVARSMGWKEEDHRSFRNSLHLVAETLSAHGYSARAEPRKDALRIVSENCPFGEMVVDHPVICAMDRGLVRGMLSELHSDPKADIEESRPMGHQHCVTAVEEPVSR